MSQHTSRARRNLVIALAALLVVGGARAAGEQIPRSAVTGGGGAAETVELRLRASIGQPAAGTAGGTLRLCAGLVCGTGAPDTPDPAPSEGHTIFLPLLVK